MTLSQKDFPFQLEKLTDFSDEKTIAVALSGGGDSMALSYMVAAWAKKKKIAIHFLTVDHALRVSSEAEAKQVAVWVKDWPNSAHKILTWRGAKPKTKIQEAARAARYKLMAAHCRKHKIKFLLLAHHGDDQIETFLFRLAKGSGLDGLTAMRPVQIYNDNLTLLRPLLNYTHEDLLSVCRKSKLKWIEDPSNDTNRFARVRLRQSRDVLKQEGLTSERILTLSRRLERARNAMVQATEKAEKDCLLSKTTKRIEISLFELQNQPDEIVLRILQNNLARLNPRKTYPAKMRNLEQIVDALLSDPDFKSATLAGSLITVKRKLGLVLITPEIMSK